MILSCPPGFEERMRLDRAAVEAGVPLIDAAQWGMSGTLIVVRPGHTACLECVYAAAVPDELSLPDEASLSEALAKYLPQGRSLPPTCLVAVSGKHLGTLASHADQPIRDGDELVLIAPVAGG